MSSRSDPTITALSHRGLAVVGVRLLAVYALVRAVEALAYALAASGDGPLAPALVLAITAAALWWGTARIAGWMLPVRRAVADAAPSRVTAEGVAGLAVALAGVLLLVDALPEFVLAVRLQPAVPITLNRLAEPPLVRPLLDGVLAIALVFGSGGVARLIAWMRVAGRA